MRGSREDNARFMNPLLLKFEGFSALRFVGEERDGKEKGREGAREQWRKEFRGKKR